MKNRLPFILITVFAFSAAALIYAFYQQTFFVTKTVPTELPIAFQTVGQSKDNKLDEFPPQKESFGDTKDIKTTPAFYQLALHESKVDSELKNLLSEYMPTSSEVLSKQFELETTQAYMAKVSAVTDSKKPLLNVMYGKLLVRKIKAETELRDSIKNFPLESSEVNKNALKLQAIDDDLSKFPFDLGVSKQF